MLNMWKELEKLKSTMQKRHSFMEGLYGFRYYQYKILFLNTTTLSKSLLSLYWVSHMDNLIEEAPLKLILYMSAISFMWRTIFSSWSGVLTMHISTTSWIFGFVCRCCSFFFLCSISFEFSSYVEWKYASARALWSHCQKPMRSVDLNCLSLTHEK